MPNDKVFETVCMAIAMLLWFALVMVWKVLSGTCQFVAWACVPGEPEVTCQVTYEGEPQATEADLKEVFQ